MISLDEEVFDVLSSDVPMKRDEIVAAIIVKRRGNDKLTGDSLSDCISLAEKVMTSVWNLIRVRRAKFTPRMYVLRGEDVGDSEELNNGI